MEINIRYNDLKAENEQLKTSITTLAIIHTKQTEELKALKEENAALRRELGKLRLLESRPRPVAPKHHSPADCKVMSINPQK